jgi:hypothetical protein
MGKIGEQHELYIGCGARPMVILKEVVSTRITKVQSCREEL